MSEVPGAFNDDREFADVLNSVDEVDAALGGQRDIITRAMISHQALHEVTSQDRATSLAQAKQEIGFLQSFASKVFPVMHEVSRRSSQNRVIRDLCFKPKDYAEANLLQALSLWARFAPRLVSYGGSREIPSADLWTPAFLIGARAVEGANVELLLATPTRLSHIHEVVATPVTPSIVSGQVKAKDFDALEEGFRHRLIKYARRADSTAELPLELQQGVQVRWPNNHSSPTKLHTKKFGRGIKISAIDRVNCERVVDEGFPLHRFDYPTRMRDLAGDFDQTEVFKKLLEKKLSAEQP